MNSAALRKAAKKVSEFPFTTYLSFLPIIRHWESLEQQGTKEEKVYARSVLKEMDRVPAFRKPIKNHGLFVTKNREMVDKLLSAVFPKALEFNEIKSVSPPFHFDHIAASSRFQKIIEQNGGELGAPDNLGPDALIFVKYLHACLALLDKFYGRSVPLESPFIFRMKDPVTRLDKYYKMTVNGDFLDIKLKGKLKELSEQDIDQMLNNILDADLWTKNLPAKSFEINGLVICSLVNVTLNELLSQLKNNLLEKDALLTETQFEKIRFNVRSLLNIPDLRVGLGVFNSEGGIANFGHWSWRDLICKEGIKDIDKEFNGSIYHKVLETGEVALVQDINDIKHPTGIEKAIQQTCVRSIIVAPLKYNNKIIGYLELGSGSPKDLNPFSMARVEDILPLFSVAIQRSVEERKDKIDAILMEKCTAIHNSVQWRFQESAQRYLTALEQGFSEVEMEPIVFEEVYPLFGMSDIRDSSEHRNIAIQEDLTTQLELAQKIILKARSLKEFPVLEEINYRIEKLISSLKGKLQSEDESKVYRLLNKEVEPLFDYITTEFPSLSTDVAKYQGALDPKLKVVYNRRKSYELSVTKINSAISEFLDKKEEEAQMMYPHYFEKYKTDGVDYNIYIGKSLLKNGIFNNICLSNLRLWQLIMMTEMTQVTAKLESELPILLRTAQLILVHDEPMAIRFRFDEKKFDVDGAYNIRYEIIKKRIDKALIKNTEERVTQPGTIAVVYTEPEVLLEYQQYFEFLHYKNLIEKEVELLELEDTQGVTGLRAIRVKVVLNAEEIIETSEIEEIISSLQKKN